MAHPYTKKSLFDGFSLYNLENDPFELDNLVDPSSGDPAAYQEIIVEIMEYIQEEKTKGHILPPIPGDENGKLYTRVFQKMGPVYGYLNLLDIFLRSILAEQQMRTTKQKE